MRTWTLFIERTKPETVYDIKFGPTADCIQVEVIDKSAYDELKAKLEQAKRIAMDCQNAESYARRLWHEEATELKLLAEFYRGKLVEILTIAEGMFSGDMVVDEVSKVVRAALSEQGEKE